MAADIPARGAGTEVNVCSFPAHGEEQPNFIAIAGQDAIPEALEEMKVVRSALVATVSHEVHTYGPRLMQLALALVRGQHVAPYHYVNYKVVASETLTVTAASG